MSALQRHVRLLRKYARSAFEERDADFFGEVAGKLRLLAVDSAQNEPLLLNLLDQFGSDIVTTLSGPPFNRAPGMGEVVTLRTYMERFACAIRLPSNDELHTLTNAQLVKFWAEQSGAAHEAPRLHGTLEAALTQQLLIAGLPAIAAQLRAVTRTVLWFADRLLERLAAGYNGAVRV